VKEARVHVVSNADLRAGTEPGLDDPEGLAAIAPAKREALLSNPLLGPADEAARLLAESDDRVVGRYDLLAGEIESPAGAVRTFWGSALEVSAAARGRGIGSTLLRTAESLSEGAAACGPSRLSYPLYVRLGYLDLPLRRHVLLRRPWRLLRGLRSGRAAVGRGRRGLLAAVRKARARGLRLEACTAFPSELEPRLREGRAPFAMHRSAAWFDWVVRESFGYETQRRALYLVRRGDETLGYLLLKARVYSQVTRWSFERLHLGSLADWRIFEPAALGFGQLVLLAAEELDEWGVDAVEACVPATEDARLGRLGFVPVGSQHVVVRGEPFSGDASAWTVRPAEGDYVFS
jgi:GNAT superfamily N-acetyltransferase